MKVKEHPELDDSPSLNDKNHKNLQHIIGVCQWLIVAGRFHLAYSVSSLIRFSDAPRVGHLELTRRIFGDLKKYPKIGCSINPQPLTINADHEKFQMKYGFVNKYSYFNEDIEDQFPEYLLDELDIHVIVDAGHGHDKVTGRSITGLFSVVGSTLLGNMLPKILWR